jgi:probable HAF family extracellular repeat protein
MKIVLSRCHRGLWTAVTEPASALRARRAPQLMIQKLHAATWSLILLCAGAAGADNRFTAIDYPNAGGTWAWGINSRGDIAGYYTGADNIDHGFLLNGGHFTAIDYPGAAVTLIHGISPQGDIVGEFGMTATSPHRGFLLGADGVYTTFDFPGATTTALYGINARGEMAGMYTLADSSRHTFLSSGGRLTKIDYPGASATGTFGITPQGEVYGVYVLSGTGHGYVYSTGGGFTTIDYPSATFTYVTGRNVSGDIAGHYIDSAGVSHGYILSNGQFTSIDYPGASFTALSAIDPAGNIAGRCTVNGVNRGFLLPTSRPPLRYTVRDLGTVGALPGQPFTVNDNRSVAGVVMTGSGLLHAVVWSGEGIMNDLGSDGLNSIAFGINDSGVTVGQAEIAATDPGGEDFCGTQALGLPGTNATCAPFAAQNGIMSSLRTLGGANGRAYAVNSRGQIAGTAENTTLDPACPSPQKYQFKPVLWQGEEAVELPTADGDRNGFAASINENGDVVGASGNCVAYNTQGLSSLQTVHALLWETGRVIDLGNLGGNVGHIAKNINNNGEVVGSSDLAGDKARHAFRWTRNTGMQDLGTVPGDGGSAGLGINDQGVITGVSTAPDFSSFRAFVWSGGVMTDLNQLIPANSALYLLTACSINARGEIIGFAMNAGGQVHGYLAAPVGPEEADFEMGVSPLMLSPAARDRMRHVGLELAPGKPGR